ncbi:hypothetical protein V1514DRAFT_336183 [Lipomyces japonicus]|uniref:uncharacterized protein n=1 Tax=Lipomyces japonicus TaxID=56871 RepID=UPI0034CF7D11
MFNATAIFNNLHIFDNYKDKSLREYFPVFIAVSGYILFRPYLMKWSENVQKAQLRKTSQEEINEIAKQALEPAKPDEEVITEYENNVWGRSARRRQRDRIREIEKAQRRQAEMEQEDDSDKEIEDLLIRE